MRLNASLMYARRTDFVKKKFSNDWVEFYNGENELLIGGQCYGDVHCPHNIVFFLSFDKIACEKEKCLHGSVCSVESNLAIFGTSPTKVDDCLGIYGAMTLVLVSVRQMNITIIGLILWEI